MVADCFSFVLLSLFQQTPLYPQSLQPLACSDGRVPAQHLPQPLGGPERRKCPHSTKVAPLNDVVHRRIESNARHPQEHGTHALHACSGHGPQMDL